MELPAQIKTIASLDEETIFYSYYSSEVLNNKISFSDYKEKALDCKNLVLHKIEELFQVDCDTFPKLAEKYFIKLDDTPLKNDKYQNNFALFTEPNIIQVNTGLVLKAREIVEEGDLSLFDGVDLIEILMLHEAFHYIVTLELEEELNKISTIEYKAFFRTRRAPLMSLEELSASLFIKHFLKLCYNVEVFNFLFTYAKDKMRARTYFNFLCECEKKLKTMTKL